MNLINKKNMTRKRRLDYDELSKNKSYSEYKHIPEYLEKGQISPIILSECCMPNSEFYEVQYVSKNDVISLYNELKSKIPSKIKEVINSIINPTYKYWIDRCVDLFTDIIQQSSNLINLNLIYSAFEIKLNSLNLEGEDYFP